MEGFIPLLTQRSQLHLLEQLPLSLCTYPFFVFGKRIWLRIAHFEFQGFSEFESYHLVGFHTKAQSN